jgi:hypothetical protein
MMDTLRDGLLLAGLATQFFLVLLGLRSRNRQLSYSFFIYLVVSFASSLTISYLISGTEISRSFYVVKEFALDALKTSVLIEFNQRVFRFYPQVRRSNYGFIVLAIFGLFLYLWLIPAEKGSWWGTVPLDVHAKIMQANCFLFFVFTGSILFYRLHIDERHKLLLIGFLFSQFPLALGFAAAVTFGDPARALVSRLNSSFFVIALLIWAKVYLKNDSVDHTHVVADSRVGRSLDSGPAQ